MPGVPAGVTAERERLVANQLAKGARPVSDIAKALKLSRDTVYGTLWRLSLRNHVEKIRDGSRTPLWRLTKPGAKALGVAYTDGIAKPPRARPKAKR